MSVAKYTEEKILTPGNGIRCLVLITMLLIASVLIMVGAIFLNESGTLGTAGFAVILTLSILGTIACSISYNGLKMVNPNEAMVLSLFGKYYGTIYENGFWFVNPFASAIAPRGKDTEAKDALRTAMKENRGRVDMNSVQKSISSGARISTKVATFVNGSQKVNDKLGNPVEVSAIVIWKVVNATKAVLNVDRYEEYLSNQTDSTIRNVARLYPYDIIDDRDDERDEANEKTLRGSALTISQEMRKELADKVADAGIEIVDVKLNQLAYAPEIAAAMLQRQQAIAVIAARRKIVEGAVSMVEMALDKLKKDSVVELDEERKAQMVSNLLVVLCSSKEAGPVLNTGSIY